MPASLDDYEVLCTIGSGSYGTCKKIKRKKDSKTLVWKEMDYGTMSENEKQMLVSEVNLLRELKHEHIVRYYDRMIDRSTTTLYIIMEFCEGGDLSSYIAKIKKEGRNIDEPFVWRICYQLVSALKECHCRSKNGKTVLHRDLKPANVFLDSTGNVKLGDFGLARVLNHDTSFAKTFVGTPYYMSPEQMNYMSYNEKSDVWSLGCMLYEMCALRPPFTANNQRELASRICVGYFQRIPLRYSDDLNDFISYLLQVEEYKRPTIDKLLDHPLLLKHRPAEKRSSVNSDDSNSAKADALRRKEDKLQEREKQLLEREKKILDKEREILEKQQQLADKERQIKLKEMELECRERNISLKERATDDKLARVEKLLDSPRPKMESTRKPSFSRAESPRLAMRDLTEREPGEIPTMDSVDTDSSSILSDPNLSSIRRLGSILQKKNIQSMDTFKKKVHFSVDKENLGLINPLDYILPKTKELRTSSSSTDISSHLYNGTKDVSAIQKQLELEHYKNLMDVHRKAKPLRDSKLTRDVERGLSEMHLGPSEYGLKYHARDAWRY